MYNNTVANDFPLETGGGFGHDYRGGTGMIFNNTARIGTSGVRGKIQVREEHEDCADPVRDGYIWNNRNSNNDDIIAVWHEQFDQYQCIEEDVDWWDDADVEPGGESPSNFFCDLSGNRSSECTDNDCFWETDTQMLYRCVGDDNWTFIYTPYTYPHPLSRSR